MRHTLALLLVIAGLLTLPHSLWAQSKAEPEKISGGNGCDNKSMVEGIDNYGFGEFQNARQLLQKALTAQCISDQQRLQIRLFLALTYIKLNEADTAKTELRKICELDPTFNFHTEQYGKAAYDVLSQVRCEANPPKITHTPILEAEKGNPIPIQAIITDEVGVAKATIFYKIGDVQEYSTIPMSLAGPNSYRGILVIPNIDADILFYYIRAEDKYKNVAETLQQTTNPYLVPLKKKHVALVERPVEKPKAPISGGYLESDWYRKPVPMAGAGAAIISFGAGAFCISKAYDEKDQYAQHPGDDAARNAAWSSINKYQTLGWVAMGAGTALTAGSIYFFLKNDRSISASGTVSQRTRQLAVLPLGGTDGAGLLLQMRY
jgi:hypothetical protein